MEETPHFCCWDRNKSCEDCPLWALTLHAAHVRADSSMLPIQSGWQQIRALFASVARAEALLRLASRRVAKKISHKNLYRAKIRKRSHVATKAGNDFKSMYSLETSCHAQSVGQQSAIQLKYSWPQVSRPSATQSFLAIPQFRSQTVLPRPHPPPPPPPPEPSTVQSLRQV